MKNTLEGADPREARRLYCEDLLSRYPSLSADELADFKHWFQKEASAYETAILSTRDALADQYAMFKKEHVDPFTWRDAAFAIGFRASMAGILLGIVALGT